jgi:hypothetical protein
MENNIYMTEQGLELINDSNYPYPVVEFLNEERKYLQSVIGHYDVLLEVGCMTGRHLAWAMKNNVYYMGVDVVEHYLVEARKKACDLGMPLSKYKFVNWNAESIDGVLNEYDLRKFNSNRILIFFPFNCFGNISNISNVINSLKKSGCHYLISTYKTDESTSKSRLDYYKNCEYKSLSSRTNEEGVVFTSQEGFKSVAYHPHWLKDLFNKACLEFKACDFSSMGIMYANT